MNGRFVPAYLEVACEPRFVLRLGFCDHGFCVRRSATARSEVQFSFHSCLAEPNSKQCLVLHSRTPDYGTPGDTTLDKKMNNSSRTEIIQTFVVAVRNIELRLVVSNPLVSFSERNRRRMERVFLLRSGDLNSKAAPPFLLLLRGRPEK